MIDDSIPRARLVLLKASGQPAGAGPDKIDLASLCRQLKALPGFDQVEVEPAGASIVYALVPARNSRERDRLKAMVDNNIDGWQVIEEQTYRLPTTF